jgi:hypothetical protein
VASVTVTEIVCEPLAKAAVFQGQSTVVAPVAIRSWTTPSIEIANRLLAPAVLSVLIRTVVTPPTVCPGDRVGKATLMSFSGVPPLLTVMVRVAVAVPPEASSPVSDRVCTPSATVVVFQSKLAVGESTYSNAPQNVHSSAGSTNNEL